MVSATVVDFQQDVLTLAFPSKGYADRFRAGGDTVGTVRSAIQNVIGVRVRFRAIVVNQDHPEAPAGEPAAEAGHTPKYGEAVIREVLKAVPIDDGNGH